MTNKKVIVIVLVFLIGGLLVYSFAATPSKPLKENDTQDNYENNDNTGDEDNKINEDDKKEQEELLILKTSLEDLKKELEEAKKSGKYTDESLNEKEKLINIANNATTKEEYDKAMEDVNNFELVEKEENPNGITTPIKNPSSGNDQTIKPSGSGNQGTTVKPSTPSTGNQESTGNNQESTSGNQGTSSGDNNQETPVKPVVINKDEVNNLQSKLDSDKTSGKYTDESIAKKQELIDIANNATTKEEYDKALEDIKNFELVEKVPANIGSSTIEVAASPTDSSDKVNVTSKQNGTDIILGGSIETKSDVEGGQYLIKIKVIAPRILSDEVLKNAKFRAIDNVYGVPTYEMPAYNRILNIQNIASEKAYITLPLFSLRKEDIMNESAPLRVAMDWGNGENIIYNIYFNEIIIK